VPIGVWATTEGAQLRVRGSVLASEPSRSVFIDRRVPLDALSDGLTSIADELRPALGGDDSAR